MISGIGYKKVRELIEQLGSAEKLLKTSAEILSEQFHIAPKLEGIVKNAKQSHSFQIEKRIIAETPGIQLFCTESSGFPLRLQHISSPTYCFVLEGKFKRCRKPLSCFCGFQRMHSLQKTANTQAD